ncbi:hypothetical protein M758_11G015400 [Ceratodon purpureus]|uniref:Uncharacterized protein n=1 Tax=Ceratodon purpureus TaxID=3225 RepID=A0A8T0GA37_CERPU|nr:hypothetical protein KC19_11G017400 [Ceratodon purpureus]KAG0600202.1 hypothetical protein M758_11G015400 [Ceratodon purpureus]
MAFFPLLWNTVFMIVMSQGTLQTTDNLHSPICSISRSYLCNVYISKHLQF